MWNGRQDKDKSKYPKQERAGNEWLKKIMMKNKTHDWEAIRDGIIENSVIENDMKRKGKRDENKNSMAYNRVRIHYTVLMVLPQSTLTEY